MNNRVIINGIDYNHLDDLFLKLIITSRKRPMSYFEKFLFSLIYAHRQKREVEILCMDNKLEILDTKDKDLSITQRFLYDDVIGESIRFDKHGNKKEVRDF